MPSFTGVEKLADKSLISSSGFQEGINCRIVDGILTDRGGQSKVITTAIPGEWDGLYDAGGLNAGLSLYMAGLAMDFFGAKSAPDLTLSAGVYYVPVSFYHASDDTRYFFLIQRTKPYSGTNLIYTGPGVGATALNTVKALSLTSQDETNVSLPLSASLGSYLGLTNAAVPGVSNTVPWCAIADNGTAYVVLEITAAIRLYSVTSGGWTLAKTFSELSAPISMQLMAKLGSNIYAITRGTSATLKDEIWTAPTFATPTDFGTTAQTGFARQFFTGLTNLETTRGQAAVATSGGQLFISGFTDDVPPSSTRFAAVLRYNGTTQVVEEIPVPGGTVDSRTLKTFLIGSTVFALYEASSDGVSYFNRFASWNGSAWVDVGAVPLGADGVAPIAQGWLGSGAYAYALTSDQATGSYPTALVRTQNGTTFEAYGPQYSGSEAGVDGDFLV